jgi:FkbM family methyltransferase
MVSLIDNQSSQRRLYEQIIFGQINNFLSRLVGKTRISRKIFNLYSRILPIPEITVRGVTIKAIIPLNQIGVYDTVKNWEIREPEVLDWIDGFEKDCTFFDVGAGFGTETLYAALKSEGPKKIVSFDLSLESSFNLAYNIMLNNITNVDQYYLALSDETKLVSFSEPTQYFFVAGRQKYDFLTYKTLSISTDKFIEMTNVFPDYIKIDVDGAEQDVIAGMRETIKDIRLKSVVIEVSEASEAEIKKVFEKAGFRIDHERKLEDHFKNIIFRSTAVRHAK